MAVYNAADAAANADKIDLVYVYRKFTTARLITPWFPRLRIRISSRCSLPAGVNRNSKLIKVFNLQDYNLARLQYGIYIDDVDFQKLDFTNAPDYAINLKAEAGTWVETADGKFRAYIYINSVINQNASLV